MFVVVDVVFFGFRQLLGGTLAVEYQVLRYMRENRLFGFGRQSWLDRALMEASERMSTPWWIAAGTLLVVAVGAGMAAQRRGGGRVSAAGFASS